MNRHQLNRVRSANQQRLNGGMTRVQFADAVLQALGDPVTRANEQGLVGWINAEGGFTHKNPLNTTQDAPGATTFNSIGVKTYPDWQTALSATVKTLRNGHYGGILAALKQSNKSQLASAIGASPWGTSASLVSKTIAEAKVGAHSAPDVNTSSTVTSTAPKVTPGRTTTDFSAAMLDAVQHHHGSLIGKYFSDINSGQFTTTTPAKVTDGKVNSSVSASVSAADPSEMVKGLGEFDGKKVAAWIEPLLKEARATGLWKGGLNSGWRSDAEQTEIYKSGVRPAAVPRSMGGSGSNHEGTNFPEGAVDVSDPQGLAAALKKLGKSHLLVYAGSKDPVHFSHPHNGGY